MSERELRVLALSNQKKKRDRDSGLGRDDASNKREGSKISGYPEMITPLSEERRTRRLRKNTLKKECAKSDPVECSSKLDTQSSLQCSHERGHSLIMEGSEGVGEMEEDRLSTSCILDYATPSSTSSCRTTFHSHSISDHTTEASSCSLIPKNYRYSIRDFKFLAPVNSGSFGKICLVEMISTGEQYAMKIINSEEAIATNREDYVESEWNVFRQVNSEYIVRCYYTFYYAKFLCFVMEYLSGGDLSFFLKKYTLSEKVILFLNSM